MQVRSFWLGYVAFALAASVPGAAQATDDGPVRIGLRCFPPLTDAEQ
jgi:hypothetical protein